MKDYDQLTQQGKLRRLHQLAHTAVAYYPLQARKVQLLKDATNTLYKVQTANQAAYVLRICRPGWRTDTDIRSEIDWLQALEQETDIYAPQPQPTRDGEYIIHVRHPGIPEPRRCVLVNWLPGMLLEKKLNEKNLFKLGVLFARLHQQAANFIPPPDFTTRRMDNIYARGEEDVLFGPNCQDAFTPHNREIFTRTMQTVTQAFANLYADPSGLRVIHNDLWHGNVKIFRGQLYPFDFEDTIWGYPVQDIAMSLQDLMSDVTAEQFEPLQAAFRQGYESTARWPETYPGQIDTFRAGRMIWVANYVARYERDYLAGFLDKLAKTFARFLENGKIRKE